MGYLCVKRLLSGTAGQTAATLLKDTSSEAGLAEEGWDDIDFMEGSQVSVAG